MYIYKQHIVCICCIIRVGWWLFAQHNERGIVFISVCDAYVGVYIHLYIIYICGCVYTSTYYLYLFGLFLCIYIYKSCIYIHIYYVY